MIVITVIQSFILYLNTLSPCGSLTEYSL